MYKIDKTDRSRWKFALYEQRRFLGIKYWTVLKYSNQIRFLEEEVEEYKKLPRYYSA